MLVLIYVWKSLCIFSSVCSVRATESQIANILKKDRTVINRHVKNAYKDKELNEAATSAKIAQVQKEANREITRELLYYN